MTLIGWLQIAVFCLAVLAATKPLGVYLFRVFERKEAPFDKVFLPVERLLFRLSGIDPEREQDWKRYALSLLFFSVFGVAITFLLLLFQHLLPLNPEGRGPVRWDLALNTAISFTTNTNWQAYSGEATMSHFSQMAALAWHNFVSAAAGMAVAVALSRGLTRRFRPDAPKTIGNFWADLVRCTTRVLLPLSVVVALFFASQGVVQTLSPSVRLRTLEGGTQVLATGPVASQEVIKMLGTNGGGFFNANSAHPFENPSPLTNFVQMFLIFAIPSALTYAFGRMAGDQRQGWVLFAAMLFLFLAGVATAYWAEAHPNPALAGLPVAADPGNMEGKEVRFGIASTALFATVTTAASCGAVNAMHDSFTPLGGLVPLLNIQLGEVIFGGVGAGLYGMLVFVLLSVFLAGLMVGRTPEYLGKKIEAWEIQLVVLYVLIFPLVVLGFSAWAAVAPYGLGSLANGGPHGLSEILYAFSSGAGNNGSAFAGLNADTPWWNLALAVAMLAGRFLMILPVLALAGSMAGKRTVPPSSGTFPTFGATFAALLVGVIVIVGALTFFPALTLGPVVEHFLALEGRLF